MKDKRQHLIDTAIRLFHERGFWETPTARIAKAAGVANGTLFNYFPTKTDLIEAVFLGLKAEWVAFLMPENSQAMSPREAMRHVWMRAVDWAMTYPQRHALLMQMKLSEHVADAVQADGDAAFEPVLALVRSAQEAGEVRDMPLSLIQSIAAGQLDATIHYITHAPEADRESVAATSFDVFWRGIAAPDGKEERHDRD